MWARLDDQFHLNTKQLAMSDPAFRLYVCALTLASAEGAQDRSGFLSEARVGALTRVLHKSQRQIDELVRLHAWETVPGGWRIHDFEEYAGPMSAAERQRRHRQKRHEDVTPDVTLGNGTVTGVRDTPARAPSRPVPSRPVQATNPHPLPRSQGAGSEGVEVESPRELGTNPRAQAANPRARGDSPRQTGRNPRATAVDRVNAEVRAWAQEQP